MKQYCIPYSFDKDGNFFVTDEWKGTICSSPAIEWRIVDYRDFYPYEDVRVAITHFETKGFVPIIFRTLMPWEKYTPQY